MDINSFVIGFSKGKKGGKGFFSTEENDAGGLTYVFDAKQGGGVKLNIAYGDTPPTDTTKLWVKTTEPSGVVVSSDTEISEGVIGDKEKLTATGTLPSDISVMASAGVGNKVYMFGCNDSSNQLTHILCYDTDTETIETIEKELNTPLSGAAPAAVGTKVYLFGGYGKVSGISSSTYTYRDYIACYDTEKNWTLSVGATLPVAANNMTAAVVGTKIYLFGGKNASGLLDTILCFDAETEEIATLSETLPDALERTTAVAMGTKVYLFGGKIASDPVDTILCFDSETEKLTTLSATLPEPKYDVGVGVIGSRAYLFGGYDASGSACTTILCFDSEAEEITTLSTTLPYRRGGSGDDIATAGDIICLFGGLVGDDIVRDIYEFEARSMLLAENVIQIYPTLGTNMFRIVNTPATRVEIGVSSVFKGNAEDVGEKVEAALYRDGEWKII
jgi:N-acetylneuraminic acid mutarotase